MLSIFRTLSIACVSLGALLVTACGIDLAGLNPGGLTVVTGSGKVVTETRSVSGFDGVVVNGAGKLYIDQTGQESLSIAADDNLLPYIVTEVRGGKLVIEFKPQVTAQSVTDLTYNLTVANLNSLELNGATAVQAKNMQVDHLTVSLSGAGGVQIAGRIDQQDVTLSGTGGYNAENVQGKRATVTNNGAGYAVVRVSDQLNATINGVGYVEYIGNPQVTKSVNGLGTVRQR